MSRTGRQTGDVASGRVGRGGSRSGAGLVGVRSVSYATSPLLASKTPPWRSRFVMALVGVAFAALLGKAVYVQAWATDFYQAEGDKRFVHKQPLPASRGRILDRHGLALATSVALPSVQAERKTFAADSAQRRELAQLLGLSAASLEERLAGRGHTATLRRHVDTDTWERVQALNLPGVVAVMENKRSYNEGAAAAHVVGFTNVDEKGLEGIELAFQEQLTGRRGQRLVLRDRLGRVVETLDDTAQPVNGGDVQLSLDSKLQSYAYRQVRDAVQLHGAKSGSAVVLDARTGEVLALANFPSYDPGERITVGSAALRNRAVTDIFEPGSTMKPFTVALAMESGRVRASTVMQTAPGYIVVTGSTIRDTHAYGPLTVAQVIQKSSNVGTVKLAQMMPAREMWEMFTAIGLGQKPKLEFPGVATGRLRPYKTWRPVEQATMSYGYGLSASLLQLARAYTVFAHDGELLPLTLLKREPAEGEIAGSLPAPVAGQRVFSPDTARQVREMLRLAAGPGGTAPKAQAIGYSVGGKTGTARKQIGKTYSDKYRSWFVGLAPIGQPRIVVAVMVDEPSKGGYYGGDVAAPVFSQVVQESLRQMGVAPDIEVQPQITGGAAVLESF
jgi:cell division protein FtsI (penicillin-binding protein 3)